MPTEHESQLLNLKDGFQYQEGAIISRSLLGNKAGNITFFAIAEGEGLSEHSAPYDAFVYILEGKAAISIAGKEFAASANDSIVLPGNVPHALQATTNFRMLLVMLKASE